MIENFDFGCIAIVGDLILDQYLSGDVGRISPEAPVPVLLRSALTAVPGGAANVAMNAATLGCQVRLVGAVGHDAAAQTLRATLVRHPGIHLDGLVEAPEWTTITKTRVLSGRQQIVRIDEEELCPFSPQTQARLIAALQDAIAHSTVVVCSDYAKGVLSDDILAALIATAKARGVPVIVDPKRKTFAAYQGADLITPNRAEMAQATGLPLTTDAEVEHAARVASAQFGGDVLLTRSEHGMSLWQRNGDALHVAARKSEVYDVSGAGDTVVATIASVLSAGQSLETAVVIATTAASIAVSKLGTATVTREELSHQLADEVHDSGALLSWDNARMVVENWRRHGMRVVFTNGCFDLLHPGHIALLRNAARQGDKLVVAINSDASVKRLKGESRPVQDELARAQVIGALRDVDMVVIFEDDTPLALIQHLNPNVLVKGGDYTVETVVGADFVHSQGGKVVLIDIVEGRSTTRLVQKMQSLQS